MNDATPAATQNLLRQLADIEGLRGVAWWPLAPGWWIVLGLCAALTVCGIWFYVFRRNSTLNWQSEALTIFSELEGQLNAANAQRVAASLNVTLRRVAMQKFSRIDCAGLEGEQWLRWLTAHDPGHFDWLVSGASLITAPYAPPDNSFRPEAVKPLIHAARKWVQ